MACRRLCCAREYTENILDENVIEKYVLLVIVMVIFV